jgi:hypothetical protein
MKNILIKAALTGGLCLALALGFGACDNPSGGDDENTTTLNTAQDAADQFYASHRAILEKPADTLILDDEAPVNAALEAYKSLRAETKKLLAEEKAHLDILKIKLDWMKGAAENGAFYTPADLLGYLLEQPDNTADTPYAITYYGTDTARALYNVLGVAGKYAALDLSQSGVYGFTSGNEEGRAFIVSFVLPDALVETPNGTSYDPIFKGFMNLKTLSAAGMIHVGDYTLYALGASYSLATVDLPKAETIGQGAFYGCTGLTTVNLPEAVTIGASAFRSTGLTAVRLPKAVTIGSNVFEQCSSLVSAYLPEAVSLGSYVFDRCPSLTTVTQLKVVSVGDSVFRGCTSLVSVALSGAVSLGSTVFSDCTSLSTVNLSKVESTGGNVFTRCTSLTAVRLGVVPPTTLGSSIFSAIATNPGKVITIRVPYPDLYTNAGTPWSDKVNVTNTAAGYFWDNTAATRGNLTVALTGL